MPLYLNKTVSNTGDDLDPIHHNSLALRQDGAPHYAAPVRQYMNEAFPNRFVGRRGFVEWPARSPDLSPLDYFLWGYLKCKAFATKPADNDELKRIIRVECEKYHQQSLEVLNSNLFWASFHTVTTWLFNDAVSTTSLFSVDEIDDSEMVDGEMSEDSPYITWLSPYVALDRWRFLVSRRNDGGMFFFWLRMQQVQVMNRFEEAAEQHRRQADDHVSSQNWMLWLNQYDDTTQ
ncbi:hypothetical protein ANN_13018 [Periplaneta americana]|uniref:Uncharacterized protein n=1 Tax=Periplaneta americana TaxID=6978 RepID=A0ABQ8TI76_PERAM|nr:hypothetical protein ANN_13018 [Periplaneta americana]